LERGGNAKGAGKREKLTGSNRSAILLKKDHSSLKYPGRVKGGSKRKERVQGKGKAAILKRGNTGSNKRRKGRAWTIKFKGPPAGHGGICASELASLSVVRHCKGNKSITQRGNKKGGRPKTGRSFRARKKRELSSNLHRKMRGSKPQKERRLFTWEGKSSKKRRKAGKEKKCKTKVPANSKRDSTPRRGTLEGQICQGKKKKKFKDFRVCYR